MRLCQAPSSNLVSGPSGLVGVRVALTRQKLRGRERHRKSAGHTTSSHPKTQVNTPPTDPNPQITSM
ncbi:hypothetical protein RHCRD62_30778 [Rhodococcus sp. RD6.2]|nr:hypothetical protein RHCRD62_30778 [Rhodococcus sp. RD6.2]